MNLKDYRVEPDSGLFEKIERRVHRRRVARVGGVATAVVVAAVGVFLLLSRGGDANEEVAATVAPEVSAVVAETPVVQTAPSAAEGYGIRNSEVGIRRSELNSEFGGRRSELLLPHPDNSEFRIQNSELSSAAESVQPVLPQSDLQHETSTFADLILDPPANDSTVVAASPKGPTADTAQTQREPVLWAPNIIVPNGEVDENRVFLVRTNNPVSQFSLAIFNRAGRQVFKSNDILQPWDGSYNGGKVSQGTYVWIARFRDSEGVWRQEKGTVTVVR